MREVKFSVEGIEGEFSCDADQLTDYKTVKALACFAENPAGAFHAMERIYMGNDEEYMERVGGFGNMALLNDAATEAAKANNSSASSPASKGTEAK